MPKLASVLAVMTLAVGAALYAKAEILPDLRTTDNTQQAARAAEESGDLARIHRNLEAAAYNYQKALRLDPENAALNNKLGIVELQLANRGAAHKYFSLTIRYDARNASALNNLGALALVERKYKQAIRYLKQALALDESSAPAHLNMAEAWMGLNEVDRAMIETSRALELDADVLTSGDDGLLVLMKSPEQKALIDFLIAKAYAKRGNLDGALDYLRRAKDDRYANMANVYSEQEFAALWADPRLAKIVKR